MDAFLSVSGTKKLVALYYIVIVVIVVYIYLQGFSDLVPLRLIKVFDERELEVCVMGWSKVPRLERCSCFEVCVY